MTPEQLDALSDEYLLERLRSGAASAQAQAFVRELQRRGVPAAPTSNVPSSTPASAPRRASRGRLLVQLLALPALFLTLGAVVGGPLGNVMGRSALVAAGVTVTYWAGLGVTFKRGHVVVGVVAAGLVLAVALLLFP